MSTVLPNFWVPFVMILSLCIFLAWREDYLHGPQRRGQRDGWTPRYALCLEYAGRIVILAGFCGLMQFFAWTMGGF